MSKKNEAPEGFTLSLALVDALPVLFFGASAIIIGVLFGSPLFLIGAALSFLAGAGKVLWKILLAVSGKNVLWLNKQFRYLMSAGWLLMLISVIIAVITGTPAISLAAIGQAIISLPSVIFFILGICGMAAMGVLASKLDSSKAKSNWIEQCVNAAAQLCILLGLIFLL